MQLDPQGVAPDDLSHAGSVVDKAIEYMMDQKIAPISVASALLGRALGLLARTILKDPRVLILDEATSALDTRTEQEIQSALRQVSANRTTLVIAHRLSTVVEADEIIVLQEGRIAERGTHASLIAEDGLYAEMWRRQSEAVAMAEAAARAQAAADLDQPRTGRAAAIAAPG